MDGKILLHRIHTYYKTTDIYRRRRRLSEVALYHSDETTERDRDMELSTKRHIKNELSYSDYSDHKVPALSPPRVESPSLSREMSPIYKQDGTETSVRDIPLPPYGKLFRRCKYHLGV